MSLYTPLSLHSTAYLLNILCKRRHLGHSLVQQWYITRSVCTLPSSGLLNKVRPLRLAVELLSASSVTDRLTWCHQAGYFSCNTVHRHSKHSLFESLLDCRLSWQGFRGFPRRLQRETGSGVEIYTLFFKLFHCHFVTNPTNSLCTCSVQWM